MQENALFLDLVAKELMAAGAGITPDEMIKKLGNNPENLFSFALARLERSPEWKIIEHLLGLLLASQEPLAFQHIRQILGVKDYRLRVAISRLGGLLTESAAKGQHEQRCYSIFHLMFQDFLVQNESKPQMDYLFARSVQRYAQTRDGQRGCKNLNDTPNTSNT